MALCVHQYKIDGKRFILKRFPRRFRRLNGVVSAPRTQLHPLNTYGSVGTSSKENKDVFPTAVLYKTKNTLCGEPISSKSNNLVASYSIDRNENQKKSRLNYSDAQAHLQPLVEILASHKH